MAWPVTVLVTFLLDTSQTWMFLEPMARMELSLYRAREYKGSWVCLLVSTRHCRRERLCHPRGKCILELIETLFMPSREEGTLLA